MNILRDALAKQQVEFLTRCISSLFWTVGVTLIFWQNWVIGMGMFLMIWGDAIGAKVEAKEAAGEQK